LNLDVKFSDLARKNKTTRDKENFDKKSRCPEAPAKEP
jgi:hypothetical protein